MDLELHFVNAIVPVADAFSGTVNSDVIEANGEGVLFVLYKGVGTTGTSTITIDACDDTTPSNTTAVPFIYRVTSAAGDTWGAWTAATTTGFVTTAGSNLMAQIYVDAAELAEEGYEYCRLTAIEVVATDDPVLGGVLAAVVNPRYQVQNSSLID